MTLSSDRLGLIARLDLIEVEDGAVVPVDYKRGRGPHVAAGGHIPPPLEDSPKCPRCSRNAI